MDARCDRVREREWSDGDDDELEHECPDDRRFALHFHRAQVGKPAAECDDEYHGEGKAREDDHEATPGTSSGTTPHRESLSQLVISLSATGALIQ